MSGHHDQGLSHEVEEYSAKQRHQEDKSGVHQNAKCENVKEVSLKIKVLEGTVHLNIVHHEIDGVSDELAGDDLKCIRDDDEYCSED